MAKSRGFFAEMNRQAQLAEKRREQEARAAAKQQAAAHRYAEKAARDAERATAQLVRATAVDVKNAEKEAKRLKDEAMQAEVDSRNEDLAVAYEEIDGILLATLDVDDFVDLEDLRRTAEHPPFGPGPLGSPTLPPPPVVAPPEPQFVPPEGEPKGLSGAFGGKKKYAAILAEAQGAFSVQHETWKAEVAAVPTRAQQANAQYQAVENDRLQRLAAAQATYEAECAQRETEVAESNHELDQLIANLGYEVEDAIQEYVSIVLGNSIYPDAFPVEHDFEFDSANRELTLKVSVPAPSEVPSTKAFKYVKSSGEITETELSQKDQKDRYAGAVAATALRTMHEVFEADRVGRIQTISLTVGTEALDVSTGQMTETPFIAGATDRPTFEAIDLANVVPLATLEHLNALVSKNPFGLVGIDLSKGVRG
jgi:restriction system protein